jgi:hypothetical protein
MQNYSPRSRALQAAFASFFGFFTPFPTHDFLAASVVACPKPLF